MKNQKAIVTIAIGEMYVECWKKYCQPNWQAYAHKYGYDLICLEHPLDLSSRAKLRSPAWQKCLILSQGREWNMEQRPLSYELLKGGHVHFLDPRFNVMLSIEQVTYYPFLLPEPATPKKKGLLERVERKMWKLLGDPLQKLRIDAVNTVYQSSFFLHFGETMDQMPMVNPGAVSWWKI